MNEFTLNNPSFIQNVNDSAIVTNGLVIHLDFGNPKSYIGGSNIKNLGTKGGTASLVNSPTFSASNGGYISFNGTSQYISSQTLGFNTSAGFTVCLFYKQINPQGQAFWNYFWSTGTGGGNQKEMGSYSNSRFLFKDNFTVSSVLSDDVTTDWTYIAMGTNSSAVPFVYTYNRTGSFFSDSASPKFATNTVMDFETFFHTGTGGGVGGSTFYKANCAIIHAYNRELSSAELTKNFNALKGRFGY